MFRTIATESACRIQNKIIIWGKRTKGDRRKKFNWKIEVSRLRITGMTEEKEKDSTSLRKFPNAPNAIFPDAEKQ